MDCFRRCTLGVVSLGVVPRCVEKIGSRWGDLKCCAALSTSCRTAEKGRHLLPWFYCLFWISMLWVDGPTWAFVEGGDESDDRLNRSSLRLRASDEAPDLATFCQCPFPSSVGPINLVLELDSFRESTCREARSACSTTHESSARSSLFEV